MNSALSRLAPYERYTNSSSGWLGPIPTHWEIRPVSTIAQLVQTGPFGSQLHADDYVEGGVAVINPSHIVLGSVRPDARHAVTAEKSVELARHTLEKGDVVAARRGELGRCAVVDSATAGSLCGTGSLLIRLLPNDSQPEYFQHLFSCHPMREWLSQISQGSTMDNLNASMVARLRVCVPPLSEQQEIVQFLDSRCGAIDALIGKQEQLIATLRENRTATITRAVTRGLNLDVQMRDTGVAWIGLEPAHWRHTQLRHLVDRIEQGVSPQADAELADDGWGVLKSGCVNGGIFSDSQHKKLPDGFKIDPSIVVNEGDLLVCRASGSQHLVGSTAVVRHLRYRLILSDKTFRLRPGPLVSADYLEWAMNSRMYREQVRGAVSGAEGLANNLPASALKAFRFPLPPLSEQHDIVVHLRERCVAIDAVISKASAVIATQREYRSALITAAVTGKIDVRQAV